MEKNQCKFMLLKDFFSFDTKIIIGVGEMAQQLRALTALTEVLSLIPSNGTVAHNHL